MQLGEFLISTTKKKNQNCNNSSGQWTRFTKEGKNIRAQCVQRFESDNPKKSRYLHILGIVKKIATTFTSLKISFLNNLNMQWFAVNFTTYTTPLKLYGILCCVVYMSEQVLKMFHNGVIKFLKKTFCSSSFNTKRNP